jgi:hypothetical protein
MLKQFYYTYAALIETERLSTFTSLQFSFCVNKHSPVYSALLILTKILYWLNIFIDEDVDFTHLALQFIEQITRIKI